jgi:L-lactate dehydrogenase complex protein LldF
MTPSVFRERIRVSIANPSLQAALDGNAMRRVNGRIAALASLPDWRERRQRAHAVRADVIEHLDRYLDQFTSNATRNGFIVHRAQDATEAVNIVLQIARETMQHQAISAQPPHHMLIAKGKSMISEEIELNHALEHEGIKVVETDLGEFIIQLRGEKPTHIITPAVHLRRHEVGQLFHDKLGLPYTEDIPTLTAAARKVLREVFLTADLGISGVNFGVAETGTICIVTNEGNGRMCTTMPPVHIALMGMERLVPTLQDLALMLSLLPRSATAQKLSVYTQLINSPRRADEVDGASERHLVIVDNGRSRMRDSSLSEALYCIRCGACLNACPVFREIGGHAYVGADGSIAPYPGPIGSIVSPGLLGLQQFGHLAQASSLCGACKDACPVNIDLPRLLTRVRVGGNNGAAPNKGVGLSPLSRIGLRLYGIIGSSPRLFAISQALGAFGTRLVSPSSAWFPVPAFTGWGYSKDFPRVASKTFRQRFEHLEPSAAQPFDREQPPAFSPEPQQPAMPSAERFIHEAEALGVSVHRVRGSDLTARLIDLLREEEVDAAAAWDSIEGLDRSQMSAAGITLSGNPDPLLKVGITGAVAGIADTGTLLVTSGPGRPLTASLLPDIHIAILPASRIRGSLEEALAGSDVSDASAAVLITGPSRTADIEMALTIGVHGPKQLVVFLVE